MRRLSPLLVLAAACAIAAWLLAGRGSSEAHIIPGEYSMEASAPAGPIALGDQFTVQLGIFHEIPDGYQGAQWFLDYDESLVGVVSINAAPGAPPECIPKHDSGSRVLASCLSLQGKHALTFSGWAWEVVFTCLNEGAAAFDLVAQQEPSPGVFVQVTTVAVGTTKEPRHVHSDSSVCSASAPTATPTPPGPSPTPIPTVTATGIIYDLRAVAPDHPVQVGESFVAHASVEGTPYRSALWWIAYDPSFLSVVLLSRNAAAPPDCAVMVDGGYYVHLGCATVLTNALSYNGPSFDIAFMCVSPGRTDLTVVPDWSRVESGGLGSHFIEQASLHSDSVQCVEPLPFHGAVKGVDLNGDTDLDDPGELPGAGADTMLANLWLCTDEAADGIDNDGDSTADNEPPTCTGTGEGELTVLESIYADFDCDTRNDDDDGDGRPVDGSVANGSISPYVGDGPRPECDQPRFEDFLLDLVDKDAGELPEGLGAFEFQLKFDHKIFDIEVAPAGGWLDVATDGADNDGDTVIDNEANRLANCTMTIVTENDIRFGCVSTGANPGLSRPDGVAAAVITVRPEADLIHRLRPTKDNGVIRRLLDENCEIADIFGDIFPGTNAGLTQDCTDIDITIRKLEGDVNSDCSVDVEDAQLIAFRYGSFFGHLVYDLNYDLQPWPTADFDIDIKDLQFVFGRNGSTCQAPVPDEQAPQPATGVGQP